MAITDISISEELMTNAPSIKYRGNEGPKSPQEMEQMADALLLEEYEKYKYDLLEQRPEATPMSFEEFRRMVIGEGMMSGGNPLPEDPTKPVNPFAPKPTGPVLPDKRQMAAYGGIMGLDGRKRYGIGSWFQENIMDPIKENPLVASAAALYGLDTFGGRKIGGINIPGGGGIINEQIGNIFEVLNKPRGQEDIYTRDKETGELIKTGEKTKGTSILGNIGSSLTKNIVPIVGGLTAGMFTKNTESDTPGLPDDNTALQLADLKKSANILDQKQGMAAGLNFLPAVSARKFTPAEMIETYAQAAANGGRIGFNMGGGADMGAPQMNAAQVTEEAITKIIQKMQDPNLTNEERAFLQAQLQGFMPQQPMPMMGMEQMPMMAMGGRIGRAEGGIMDLGGLEKDYRAEGGFVPIGREEKADDVPARLSVNEFVFTADAVRNAGGGDIDRGAQVMENMMKHLEAGGQVSRESQGMQGARDMFEVSERLSEVV